VHELTGAEDGPVLGLVAGIHGDEPLGVEMLRTTLEAIDVNALSGSVLALAVANPYALQAGTRNTPLDMTNLNRVFPGDSDGTITEQLAHTIRQQYLPHVQYLIDYHSGGTFPTVDYMYLEEKDLELSTAYGREHLYRSPGFVGTLTGEAKKLGIPSLVSELGGGGRRDGLFVEKGSAGSLSVMRQLNMIPGRPARPGRQWIFDRLVTLRPHQGGSLRSRIKVEQLGSRVPGGTVLGEVRHSATFDLLETIRAPFDSSILILAREGVSTIGAGDYAYMIGDAASATVA
jgi:predicted deacylase